MTPGDITTDKMKTENAYFYHHRDLKKRYGNASCCENKDCKSVNPKRYEWALRKGHTYSSDRKDYIQLCPSCHRKYDFTESTRLKQRLAKIGKPMYKDGMEKWVLKGIEATRKSIFQLSKNGELIKEWHSITEACKDLQINNSSISNCLKGLSKNAGGYLWKLKN